MSDIYFLLVADEIDLQLLSPGLRAILSFASKWSHFTDDGIEEELKRTTTEELESFVSTVKPSVAKLMDLWSGSKVTDEVPPVVAVLQVMLRNYNEANSELMLRKSRK